MAPHSLQRSGTLNGAVTSDQNSKSVTAFNTEKPRDVSNKLELTMARRTYCIHDEQKMRVCLQKKLADVIDGVDLRGRAVGDVLDLKPSEASLLVAEEWAIPERRARDREYMSADPTQARETLSRAADRPRRARRR